MSFILDLLLCTGTVWLERALLEYMDADNNTILSVAYPYPNITARPGLYALSVDTCWLDGANRDTPQIIIERVAVFQEGVWRSNLTLVTLNREDLCIVLNFSEIPMKYYINMSPG